MTALRDSVAPHFDDQMAMIELASSCGIGSTAVASHAYDVALPVVLAGFSRSVATKKGAEGLHALSMQFSRVERARAVTLFGAAVHPLGRPAAAQVFGVELPAVQAEVAQAAGLGTAERLIEVISLVCLASAAGTGESAAELKAFVASIGAADPHAAAVPPPPAPGTDLPTTGPSAELPPEPPARRSVPLAGATLGAPSPGVVAAAEIPAPVAVVGTGSLGDPAVEERRSRTPWLLAAAAAALLLLVGGIVAFGGDDSGNSDGALVSEESADDSDEPFEDLTPAEDDGLPDTTEATVDEPLENDDDAVVTEAVVSDDDATDGDATDGDATDGDAADGDAADGDATDAAALDFASVADDPDVEVMSIPLRDIEDADRDASGVLQFGFNTVSGEVCYLVTSEGIEAPYSGHIHDGVFGEKGGIVVDLGPLESGDFGCLDNLPVDTNDILADPAGHYAEIHDAGGVWTLRGQLTENIDSGADLDEDTDAVAPEPPIAQVDPDGGGAFIRLEQGTISLEGAVADQATADNLVDTLSNVNADTPIVNDLIIEEGAPLPSGRIIVSDTIFFDTDSVDIGLIDAPTLVAITDLATSQPGNILTVVGHTDDRGPEVLNLELSLRRAAASRDLLVELGVPASSLRIRGAGETAPIGDNATPEGRALNRRIEFEFAPPN